MTENRQHIPLVTKALDITKKYLFRYGSCSIHIYRFPCIPDFICFLDSMRITFLRKGILSSYLWLNNAALQSFFLLIWERGSFDGQFESEGQKIINRLWKRHSPQDYYGLETIRITQDNQWTIGDWFCRYLLALGAQPADGPAVPLKWHQKSYSTSQI